MNHTEITNIVTGTSWNAIGNYIINVTIKILLEFKYQIH